MNNVMEAIRSEAAEEAKTEGRLDSPVPVEFLPRLLLLQEVQPKRGLRPHVVVAHLRHVDAVLLHHRCR